MPVQRRIVKIANQTALTMKKKKRKVISGVINHCYQRTVNGYLLFYDVFDCLVYFTLFCTTVRKHDVRAVAVTIMPDHLHSSLVASYKKELSSCIQEITGQYALLNNIECNRKTALFQHPFGSVPKVGDKAARTNIIYLGNNPVERHICDKAEQYRWNFLAYAVSSNPFSEPIVLRKASKNMRNAVKEVKQMNALNKNLGYATLHRLFRKLDKRERQQLIDFIIVTYNVIDYEYASSLFGSYNNMIHAMHCTTGSEYELKETRTGKTDKSYSAVTTFLKEFLNINDIHKVFDLPETQRQDLFFQILKIIDITPEQLAKYLRITIQKRDQ